MDAVKYNRSRELDDWLIRAVQTHVGVKVDGDPGPNTTAAVKAWQGAHGVNTHGKLDAQTLDALAADCVDIRIILHGRQSSSEDVAAVYPDLIQVIDLSYHQDNPDSSRDNIAWSTLAERSGASAFILKATEGRGYTDPMFARYRRECEDRGLLWSAYHYGHLAWKGKVTDPVAQAEHFVKTSGADKDRRRLWLDLERKTLKKMLKVSTAAGAVDWALGFLERVDELTGQVTGVYMSQGQIREYLTESEALRLRGRPTWWPYYASHPWPWERRDDSQRPPKPVEGWGWDLWQWSGEGRAPGIKGRVDLNVFNGSLDDLRELFVSRRGCA